MNNTILGIPFFDTIMVIGILVFFGILETLFGYLSKTNRTKSDWIQEAGGAFLLSTFIKPGIVFLGILMANTFLKDQESLLAHWSLLLGTIFFLLIDDFLQYWYHRSAHEYEFLWKLHRPHHQAEEMGFFISYRNAALYYLFMPNIWWIAFATFLGLAKGVAIGIVLKQVIIISSHSTVVWDKPFYNNKLLRPVVLGLERIFITPAFHYAHHGKSMLDGISDPNGNYGNMFSIWDQLFGTATFNHAYPTQLGLPNDPKEHWSVAYFYPLLKTKNPQSELSKGYQKKSTKTAAPLEVGLIKGQNYLYCQCGKSNTPPFCDGSHHGSKFKPLLFEAKRSGKVKLCNCKLTKQGPFCDQSHVDYKE